MTNYLSLNSIQKTCLMAALLVFTASSHADAAMDDRQLAAKLNQNWNQLFNAGNVQGVTAIYGEQAVISPGNGQVLTGEEAISGLFQSFVDNGVHNHTIDVVSVHREGNTLYQVSNWQASGKEQDGVVPTFGGVVTLVSTLNAQGEWELQVHSWNMKN